MIPPGVQVEYDAAVQRTGLTPQLEQAHRVLSFLFWLNDPSAVQRVLENCNKLGLYA